MSVLDDKIKAVIAEHGTLKTIISVFFSVLTFAKARGWFSRSK